MSAPSDVIILCEGYDDRSFWKGLLLRGGCLDARRVPAPRYTKAVFTFRAPAGHVVYVVPAPVDAAGTSATVMDLAREELRSRVEKPFARLVVSLDIDERTLDDARRSLLSAARDADPQAVEEGNDIALDAGGLRMSLVPWFTDAPPDLEGVPAQQALERLVCAAMARVYPDRARALAEWIRSRPEPAGKEHKAHAWSFYAGWYTQHGTGFFFEAIWKDDAVARELSRLLQEGGALAVVQSVLGDQTSRSLAEASSVSSTRRP